MIGQILFISILLLIGLIIGGGIGWIMSIFFKNHTSVLYLFGCGIILGMIFFHLAPETLQQYNWLGLIIGCLSGIILMFLVEGIIMELHKNKYAPKTSIATLLLVIGMAIHNMPTGMTIGSELGEMEWTSSALIGTFIIHQIPEGLALFLLLLNRSDSLSPFILVSVCLSLLLFTSIIIGYMYIDAPTKMKAILMGTSIATLGYASIHGIKHETNIQATYKPIFIGFAIVFLFIWLL
ncbi:hypothetical protein NC661_16490 [Aquibacillus koreensis]|uniref:Zinc transporter, ZIP family n=1 Tax=Aquibacillus koreensis TaxID=279446 RepID=A0A9X4AL26_9BACI|nr:hypothetical protein [Aquibacillus koreensis]MCT2536895.1 hypothetical protein [Aquibacillus koreensis]MDC3421973.1 hypothetical protein [Aquibacillus koreensis]